MGLNRRAAGSHREPSAESGCSNGRRPLFTRLVTNPVNAALFISRSAANVSPTRTDWQDGSPPPPLVGRGGVRELIPGLAGFLRRSLFPRRGLGCSFLCGALRFCKRGARLRSLKYPSHHRLESLQNLWAFVEFCF